MSPVRERSRRSGRHHPYLRLSIALASAVALAAVAGAAPAQADAARSQINGSGSSWAANAVNQWVADVQQTGLQVVYTPVGSAVGRKDFANGTTDFAVTDIGYQATSGGDPNDASPNRAYVYLPVVAGGTSFPYQIKIGGRLINNVRLSGETLAKIFTNVITDWSDPAITKDNNGKPVLGSPGAKLPIIPVINSQGSGSNFQISAYFAQQYPAIWRAFYPNGIATEFFPIEGNAVGQAGSDGVMNFVASAQGNGSITYDEYSYPLAKNWPVAKMLNSAGNFTLPTQYNVAVALTKAIINQDKNSPNYLLQDLRNVYTNPDPRAYPLSSYSYAIIPTSPTDQRMTTPKRQAIVDYLYYSVCQGQREIGPIGYSALPVNLVQASFDQIYTLKAADPNVDINQRSVTTCNNPTFNKANPRQNLLAKIAPPIPACDKVGQGPANGDGSCPRTGGNTGGNGGNNGGNGGNGGNNGGNGGNGGNNGGGNNGGGNNGGGNNGGGNNGGGSNGGGSNGGGNNGGGVDPVTGQPPAAGGGTAGGGTDPVTGQPSGNGGQPTGDTGGGPDGNTGGGPDGNTGGGPDGNTGGGGDVIGIPTELAASRTESMTGALGTLALLQLLALIAIPPLVAARRRRARP